MSFAARHLPRLLAGPALSLLWAAPALAGGPNSMTGNIAYVSHTGTDSTDCGRRPENTPCRTIAYALTQVHAGGEVVVADDVEETGVITIDKAITLTGKNNAHIRFTWIFETGPGWSNYNVNYPGIVISAGASDRVVLDGFTLDGYIASYGFRSSMSGIIVNSAGDIVIRNARIQGWKASGRAGIAMANTTGLRLTLDRVFFYDNDVGVLVGSTAGLGHVKVFNSMFLSNVTSGVRVVGAGNDALLSGNEILGSLKGVDLQGGAVARSYGNNVITSGDAVTPMALN